MNVWIFRESVQTPKQHLLSANYVSGTILGARTQRREGLTCIIDLPCVSHCGYFQIQSLASGSSEPKQKKNQTIFKKYSKP